MFGGCFNRGLGRYIIKASKSWVGVSVSELRRNDQNETHAVYLLVPLSVSSVHCISSKLIGCCKL